MFGTEEEGFLSARRDLEGRGLAAFGELAGCRVQIDRVIGR
jgi:hypothetical protein